ncbi:MAG: hypothetical protein ACQETE_08015 [Bacteroidota bacterium]
MDMLKKIKRKIKKIIGNAVVQKIPKPRVIDNRWSSTSKISQRIFMGQVQNEFHSKGVVDLSNKGYRVFSQFDEDGILIAIFSVIGEGNKTFIEIGAADGINSNCANFALNLGWHGLFIDGDSSSIAKGKEFYQNHHDSFLYPPVFKTAMVKRSNINELIREEGFEGDIELLSIDIDGNDYWIWDAIEVVSPKVVIIETHIEFGYKNIVVPYDEKYSYPGLHRQYHGASVKAMIKLADSKGYKLLASNVYGFNTIYVKAEYAKYFVEYGIEDVLGHRRNDERVRLFDEISDWKYVTPIE